MLKLTVTDAAGTREVSLEGAVLTIGRGEDASLPLDDPKASRRHAAISIGADGARIDNLGSRNGVVVNGVRTDSGPLRAGDEIRLGTSRLVVLEMTPPASPATARRRVVEDMKSAQRLRGRMNAALAATVLFGAAWVGWSLLEPHLRSGPGAAPAGAAPAAPEPAPRNARDEAERALEALRTRAAGAPSVTPDLVRDATREASRFNGLYPGGSPFDALVGRLMQRRAREAVLRLERLRAEVDSLLEEGRYGFALERVKTAASGPDAILAGDVAELVRRVSARVRDDYLEVDVRGRELAERGRLLEAVAHYRKHAGRFEGTEFHKPLAAKPEDLDQLARARAAAIAPVRPAPLASGTPEPDAAPAPGPDRPFHPLLPRLIDAIKAGSVEGAADADAEGLATGDTRIAWKDLPRAEFLELLEQLKPEGDDLLALAEWAQAAELRKDADRLLHAWSREGDPDRVNRTLAAWRGVEVPEGGYAWSPRHGWEDASDRMARETLARLPVLCRRIATTNDPRSLERAYGEVLKLHDAEGLPPHAVHAVEEQAVEALRTARTRRLEAFEGRAKRSAGFARLSQLKQELNRRRKDALALIYDESIYLREDHPDWRKGDRVNGQEAVDQKVLRTFPGTVGELWTGAGKLAASLDPALAREVGLLRKIDEEFLPGLGAKPQVQEREAYQRVLLNMNRTFDLSSFALDAKEAQRYAWNRRVEKYNAELRDPRVGADEKGHAKALNDYREMMGRRRLFLDPRLCVAAKKHSAVQNEAQRIWHVGPDGDPQSRARAEGFPSGVGENVAIGYGTPDDIWWRGWYRASDHHRNGLSEAWTCLGYGYEGNVGTENFGNIPPPAEFPSR